MAQMRAPALKMPVSEIDQLRFALKEIGLDAEDTSLLAMHLAEIDEECTSYSQHIKEILSTKNLDPDTLLEHLVEIKLSLEHLASHVQAVEEELDRSISALDDEE